MISDPILDQIEKLNVWSRRGERAPHKPLLILLALGRLARGEAALPFSECEPQLTDLLREFGPSRQSYHPEYPFWRLQNDGLWVVTSTRPLAARQSNTDPPKSELRAGEAVGSFPEAIRERLLRDPALLTEVGQRLLAGHFPDSLHADILAAVGLSLERAIATRKPRDPRFRARVLVAYEYRCALCGLDLRINNVTIALEAAHIRWHQAGGPDTEANGIALCSLHHKVFDLGACTVHPDHRVLVSEHAHGAGQFEQVLLRHHGELIRLPGRREHFPAPEHLGWHRREVFKAEARPL